jgi:hypothetical protein
MLMVLKNLVGSTKPLKRIIYMSFAEILTSLEFVRLNFGDDDSAFNSK